MTESGIYRIAGISFMAIWAVCLLLPTFQYVPEGAGLLPSQITEAMVHTIYGWEAAVLAPFLSLAWLAQPIGVWCSFQMIRGKRPHVLATLIATGLALSALRVTRMNWFDDHDVDTPWYPLIGAYIWASSFGLLATVRLLVWHLRIDTKTDNSMRSSTSRSSDAQRENGGR